MKRLSRYTAALSHQQPTAPCSPANTLSFTSNSLHALMQCLLCFHFSGEQAVYGHVVHSWRCYHSSCAPCANSVERDFIPTLQPHKYHRTHHMIPHSLSLSRSHGRCNVAKFNRGVCVVNTLSPYPLLVQELAVGTLVAASSSEVAAWRHVFGLEEPLPPRPIHPCVWARGPPRFLHVVARVPLPSTFAAPSPTTKA